MYVEGTAYYVGHGAMNYMEVWDGNKLEVIIIVDAGSTEDRSGKNQADKSKQDVIKKLQESSVPIIMCLTHRHEDHYSYFFDFIKAVGKENKSRFKIYLGGRAIKVEQGNPNGVLEKIINLPGLTVTKLAEINKPKILEWSNNNEIELEVIYNDYDKLCNNLNNQGAVYLLKNNSSKNAMLFTGDMTGLNFSLLNRDGDKVCEYLAEIIQNYRVYMTMPHHGSRDSLTESDFMFKEGDEDVGNFNELFDDRLKAFGEPEGDDNPERSGELYLLLSAGINDSNYHPRTCTIRAFLPCLILQKGTDSTYFEAFDNEKRRGAYMIKNSQCLMVTTEAEKPLEAPAPNNIHFTL